MDMSEHLVVLVTTQSKPQAQQLARLLLEQKLAACVQLVPIQSLYVWQGELKEDAEVLMIIKSTSAVFKEKLEPAIKAAHSYDTPEIVGLPIVLGSADYLAWVSQVVSSST